VEPTRQVEIQLGHMCNNRCVFCVSGQRTEMGEAGPLDASPALKAIEDAYESGHRKITLLGGEPTLQPHFMDIVRRCVSLGFEEIVIFTNGVRTARAEVIDEVLATGGNFTWRISIQGATEEAHVGTTKRPRSFVRILRTLEHLRARGERITVNMCVVQSNYESVGAFPALLLPFDADQLHLDMMRPLDSGERTEADMRAMLPKLSDLAGPMRTMIQGFEAARPGFDVNIGNLPYCVAPDLAPWIHHDGERTDTIAIDGDDQLSKPWNKYLIKRRDKLKKESCRSCLFDDACSGVFETYAQFYGTDELVPVGREALAAADPERRLLARHLRPLGALLRKSSGAFAVELSELGPDRLSIALRAEGASRATTFVLHRAGQIGEPAARYPHFDVEVAATAEETRAAAVHLASALSADGHRAHAPLGPDVDPTLPRSIRARLRRLRMAAPFVSLEWTEATMEGARCVCTLRSEDGGCARLWLGEEAGRATGGYEVVGEPTPALRRGLHSVLDALRPRATSDARSGA
jgi:MoaA/NifB/PqqE/SkfB family radical SAM enzyme